MIMKDSSVEWLGDIPAHWKICRVKFLCSIMTGNKDTINKDDAGKYPFFVRSPKVEKINSYSYDGEAILMAGDGVGAGKVFHYFNGKFDFHQRVYNLHCFKNVIGKYFFYYLLENFYREIEKGSAKSTVDSVRLPMILNFPVLIPPLEEQKKISAYLDKKCAAIDSAVDAAKKLVVKFGEYKKALITETVTKGLNRAAKMKDSGVEWLGDIPAHWIFGRLKNLLTLQRGFDLPSEKFIVGDFPIYGSSGLMGYHYQKTSTAPNIVIGRSGSTGKLHYIEKDFWAHNTGIFISDKKGNCCKYLYYLLNIVDMDSLSTKTAVPTLDRKKIQEYRLPYTTDVEEQKEIAAFLDLKCAAIDENIAKHQQLAEKLTEYKKSLIYEVVTGKMEV